MSAPLQGSDEETQERIAGIRARLSAATPGPWMYEAEMRTVNEFAHFQIKTVEPQPDAPWSQRFIAWMTGGRDISTHRFHEMSRYEQDKLIDAGVRDEKRCEPDAALIANAPTDLAFLLSRVDSLESALREAAQDVRKQFADEGLSIASVKDAADSINELSGMVRVEAVRRIAAERLHAKHCGLECCEARDEYEAKTRQSPIGDTGEST